MLMLICFKLLAKYHSGLALEVWTAISFAGTHLTAARLSSSSIHLTPFHLLEFFPRFGLTNCPRSGIQRMPVKML